VGERYLAVAFAAEKKKIRKKGTPIARSCLGSIEGGAER